MKALSSHCIEKLEIIGNGSFGRVFKCRDLRTGEFVAVKEIDLDGNGGADDCFDELRAEISTLMTCEHPNIIRYRGSYVPNTNNGNNVIKKGISSPLSNRLCIVMDYCARGSLRQVLDQSEGPLPEPMIADIAESILRALEYLHKQGIGHRDLKAANVLVDGDGRVKLGDFGVAFQPEDSQDDDSNKLVGSPYWMSPEVLNFSNKQAHIDASKADIWSFGITLIELLKGRPPLHYLSPRAAMAAIPRTSPPRLESDDPRASKRLRDLIHACLHDDPKKRPSASQLLKSFKSYFKQQKSSSPALLLPATHTKTDSSSTASFERLNQKKKTISETIYSQWDFDLSTLNSETSTIGNAMSSTSGIEVREAVEDNTEAIDKVTTDTIEPVSAISDSPVPQASTNNTNDTHATCKFRKLKVIKKLNIESVLWDNKDSAILPIPCPSDAPDLSKPAC